MITEPIKIEKKEKMEFKPLPENIYQVELLDVSDRKHPTYDTRNKPDSEKVYERIFKFQFTLLNGKDSEGFDLRGRNLWEDFVPVYLYEGKNGKNKLYQIVEALIGRNLTIDEEAMMDGEYLNGLIGKQCRVGVKNKKSGDKVYSNIESYYPAEAEMTKLTAEERENATVKPKEESAEENDTTPSEGEEISSDEIPFN